MSKIIHVGDGRHIELDEGAIFRPPPPEKKKYVHPRGKLSESTHKPNREIPTTRGDNHWRRRKLSQSGYKEYMEYGTHMRAKYSHGGRAVGEVPGIRRDKIGYIMGHVKRKVKKDMENIKKVMPDLDEVAAEALEATLMVLRGPQNNQQKLAAAKQLLEFTMSKPVAKSQVSVNAAEDWLNSLAAKENSEDNS